MKLIRILAVDTTTMKGSVALLEGGKTVATRQWEAEESHAGRLISEIRTCLDAAGWNLRNITYFSPVVGPGSFTGIRIGLGTVMGLAAAADGALVGITALEALAFGAASHGESVAAVIDARRNQIYAQRFTMEGSNPQPTGPACCDFPEHWLSSLRLVPLTFVGNGALRYRERIQSRSRFYRVTAGRSHLAEPAGELSSLRLKLGNAPTTDCADALYIRPPDIRTRPKRGGLRI